MSKTTIQCAPAPIDDAFESAYDTLKKEDYTPWCVPENSAGDCVCLVARFRRDETARERMTDLHSKLKCNTCHDFCKKHAGMASIEGPLFGNVEGPYGDLAGCLKGFERFEVVDLETLGVAQAGGWKHLHVKPAQISNCTTFSATDYQWFLNQKLDQMYRLLSENKGDGILESLEALIKVLAGVPYGDKLVHSIRWFREVMQEFIATVPNGVDHYWVAAKALLNARLDKGADHEAIICIPLAQVAHNGLDALKCADSIPALTKLLADRFSPLKHCRPTAEAKPGQLAKAVTIFKDKGFRTTLMERKEIPDYGGKLISHNRESKEATEIWAKSRAGRGKKSAANFAARADASPVPSTFRALFELAPDGLDVYSGGGTPICLTSYPVSARELFLHPHLWYFKSGISRPSVFGIAECSWVRVNSIALVGSRGIFFGIEGAKPAAKMGNTCFPAFLKPAYAQTCRHAFEELNNVEMGIPEDAKQFALGIGTSRTGEDGATYSKLKFRIDSGSPFTIGQF